VDHAATELLLLLRSRSHPPLTPLSLRPTRPPPLPHLSQAYCCYYYPYPPCCCCFTAMPPSYQQHSWCCLLPFCRCRLLFFFAALVAFDAPTKVLLVTRVWSLRVLSEKLSSFWPEQGEHDSVKTQRERVSVKTKKEAEGTCVQVKCFFHGDVERDLRILVNAVWFLCLLSCLAAEEEEEETCRVCCVCRISKSSIPESYSVKVEWGKTGVS
jgi:hypothetical protein